jgi:hypothetical protein
MYRLNKPFSKYFLLPAMKIWSFLILFFGNIICTQAQNSPFSGFGIGSLAEEGNIAQQLNGSTGVSSSNSFYVNLLNPALLVRNGSVVFDASYNFKIQQLRTNYV